MSTSSALPTAAVAGGVARTAMVDIVIPVYNEEVDLAASVRRLDSYLARTFPYPYRIVVADNASTDATWPIASRLADQYASVEALHLDAKGRGRALREAWLTSTAVVVAYMDVDLSTDLNALLPLVAPLVSGHSDVAIGTRLARGSRVRRGPKREFVSRGYNLLLHTLLGASFSDAQCGFKAVRRDVADRLLPLVEDNNWFFDTELLVLAQRSGLRIHEVPVDWIDDEGTTVDILATAWEDLRGIWRLLGQFVRFGAVGVASTVAYFALYLLLRPIGAQPANLVALLVTAVANTAANRRLTFGISGRKGSLRHHLGGLAAFGVALALTSGSLWLLGAWWPDAGKPAEVAVLVVGSTAATLLRFVALRLLMHKTSVRLLSA